jgi:hypothetical protein
VVDSVIEYLIVVHPYNVGKIFVRFDNILVLRNITLTIFKPIRLVVAVNINVVVVVVVDILQVRFRRLVIAERITSSRKIHSWGGNFLT